MRTISDFTGRYAFLSNAYRCDFEFIGLGRVRSAAHAVTALMTDDDAEAQWILEAESPDEARERGEHLTRRADWLFGGRVAAMRDVLDAKFSLPALAELLETTGTAPLIAVNTTHDNFWGDCRCGRTECVAPGANMLGEMLMAVRAELEESEDEPGLPAHIADWDGMLDWIAESLSDQPVGLEFGLGPRGIRLADDWDSTEADIDDPVEYPTGDDLEVTPARCVQVYTLADGIYLVRRSRIALRVLRFLDHDATSVVEDTWFHDDPFDDCTDGYMYTRDHLIAAEACVSWFRDSPRGPVMEDLGCQYSFADIIPGPREVSDEPA